MEVPLQLVGGAADVGAQASTRSRAKEARHRGQGPAQGTRLARGERLTNPRLLKPADRASADRFCAEARAPITESSSTGRSPAQDTLRVKAWM